MNRTKIRHLLNEYLDGEIGLADKAELERIMAQDPEVRAEFKELRRIGMLLSSMPEVAVHPSLFRARVADAMDGQQRSLFTPQRAFAMSMLVTMLVIGLTFAMVFYQQGLFGSESETGMLASIEAAGPGAPQGTLGIDLATSPERYFERMLIEVQLGYLDQGLLGSVAEQSTVFEGATCLDGEAGHFVQFSRPLVRRYALAVDGAQLAQLAQLAEELSGAEPQVESDNGPLLLSKYAQQLPAGQKVAVELRFR